MVAGAEGFFCLLVTLSLKLSGLKVYESVALVFLPLFVSKGAVPTQVYPVPFLSFFALFPNDSSLYPIFRGVVVRTHAELLSRCLFSWAAPCFLLCPRPELPRLSNFPFFSMSPPRSAVTTGLTDR